MSSSFQRVFNARGHRIRGLWVRNGIFYAQISIHGHIGATRIRLKDAKTIAQATAALQALKVQRSSTGLIVQKIRGVSSFEQAAEGYLDEVRRLSSKKAGTIARESSGKDKLIEFFGSRPITTIAMKDAYSFASWRKKTVSGRAVDLGIMLLRQIMAKAVRDGLIQSNPIGKWKALGTRPDKKRLVTGEEILRLRAAASDRSFSDYLELLRLSGGREQETLALKWSVSVDFGRRLLGFGQGDLARFSKNSDSRWLPTSIDLYNHLWCMWLRAPESDWLFPNRWDRSKRTGSFKKSLIAAKAACKVEDFGFHHLRHYFISQCVMSRIDYKTIAEMVGHRDGGVLIGKVYGHLNPEHFRAEATRVKFL